MWLIGKITRYDCNALLTGLPPTAEVFSAEEAVKY